MVAALLPPRTLKVSGVAPDPLTQRGSLHVHTVAPTAPVRVDEVAAAAHRAGLQFIVLTDHGDGTREPDVPTTALGSARDRRGGDQHHWRALPRTGPWACAVPPRRGAPRRGGGRRPARRLRHRHASRLAEGRVALAGLDAAVRRDRVVERGQRVAQRGNGWECCAPSQPTGGGGPNRRRGVRSAGCAVCGVGHPGARPAGAGGSPDTMRTRRIGPRELGAR